MVPEAARASKSWSRLLTAASVALAVAVLYFAREILIPLALAIFLAVLVAPMVRHLERIGLRRALSTMTVTLLTIGVFVLVGWLVTIQAAEVVQKLPHYQENIIKKVQEVREMLPTSVEEASETVKKISEEITRPSKQPKEESNSSESAGNANASPGEGDDEEQRARSSRSTASALGIHPAGSDPTKPSGASDAAPEDEIDDREEEAVMVQVVEGPMDLVSLAGSLLGPVVHPLLTFIVATVLMVFILLYREDLQDRVIILTGWNHVDTSTQALGDAARRVRRCLASLGLANGINGAAIGLGLYLLGVPNALVWGVLTALLRFVPVLGAWVAAVTPVVLSIAVSDGWMIPLLVALWILVIDQLSVNFLEPFLYGGHAGASPIAILFSFVFWTWLWGGIGLLLATPITVCLLVLGRYAPAFRSFCVLLGDDETVAAQDRLYLRVLARDSQGAARIIEVASRKRGGTDDDASALLASARLRIRREVETGTLPASRANEAAPLLDRLEENLQHNESERESRKSTKSTTSPSG